MDEETDAEESTPAKVPKQSTLLFKSSARETQHEITLQITLVTFSTAGDFFTNTKDTLGIPHTIANLLKIAKEEKAYTEN